MDTTTRARRFDGVVALWARETLWPMPSEVSLYTGSVDCGDILQNETNMWIEVEIHHTALADHKYTQTMHGNCTKPFGTLLFWDFLKE